MKGIILAGGRGTRLFPLTTITSKQLLPVYDKPMIYYPLSTLMLGGIKEIAIISTPEDLPRYRELLGSGSNLGLNLTYFEQKKPRGLAEAFIICEKFISNDNVTLILGDNIFHGNLRISDLIGNFSSGCKIFGYSVNNPRRYGVLDLSENGELIDIIEKPRNPPTNLAVPGLYIYDNKVVSFSKKLNPSARGELEITDLNKMYLKIEEISVQIIGRGVAWFDVGKSNSLHKAGNFIESIENSQRHKIGCIEEISFRKGFISSSGFENLIKGIPQCEYKEYLRDILKESKIWGSADKNKLKNLQP